MNVIRLIAIAALLLATGGPAGAADAGPEFADLAGVGRHPLDTAGHKAAVLFFVWHTCPVANSYAPEIERIYQDYKDRGVAVYLVQVDPDLKVEKARQHAIDYSYTMPVIIDRKHELVKRTGAEMTPEAAVLLPDGELIYRGRIDDRQAALGKRRPAATEFDLRDTLDAILAGKKLEPRTTKAVGCYIPETR
jgi:peroxiredoxin